MFDLPGNPRLPSNGMPIYDSPQQFPAPPTAAQYRMPQGQNGYFAPTPKYDMGTFGQDRALGPAMGTPGQDRRDAATAAPPPPPPPPPPVVSPPVTPQKNTQPPAQPGVPPATTPINVGGKNAQGPGDYSQYGNPPPAPAPVPPAMPDLSQEEVQARYDGANGGERFADGSYMPVGPSGSQPPAPAPATPPPAPVIPTGAGPQPTTAAEVQSKIADFWGNGGQEALARFQGGNPTPAAPQGIAAPPPAQTQPAGGLPPLPVNRQVDPTAYGQGPIGAGQAKPEAAAQIAAIQQSRASQPPAPPPQPPASPPQPPVQGGGSGKASVGPGGYVPTPTPRAAPTRRAAPTSAAAVAVPPPSRLTGLAPGERKNAPAPPSAQPGAPRTSRYGSSLRTAPSSGRYQTG